MSHWSPIMSGLPDMVVTVPGEQSDQKIAPVESRLLEVARLGLIGDVRSLRQQLRNLQRSGPSAYLSAEARIQLASLIADSSADAPLRAATRANGLDAREVGVPGGAEEVIDAERPVLDSPVASGLDRLLREHSRRHLLEEANLTPTSRVLLTGPPGSGKTMAARWLASELGLPLCSVEPAAVMSSLLGESAKALAAAFRGAASRPCVLFLDELDVFARRRSDTQDVAEAKRLVNTLLLELDRVPDRVVVIGATNHPEVLDQAVMRRFELRLEFAKPSQRARVELMRNALFDAGRDVADPVVRAVASAAKGRSASDIVAVTRAALRRSIIDELPIDIALVTQFIAARFTGRSNAAIYARATAIHALMASGLGVERIAELAATTPATVQDMLDRPVLFEDA